MKEWENIRKKIKIILKKIPYIYEILQNIEHIHDIYGHISFRNLSKKLLSTDFFIGNIDVIKEQYTKECPECFCKFHRRNYSKNQKL